MLDLGAGDGPDTLWFAEKGLSVISVGFSKTALTRIEEHSRKAGVKKNIKTVKSFLPRLILPEEYVDFIYSHLGVHFFDKKVTRSLFERMKTWMKLKGTLGLKLKSTSDPMYGRGEEIDEDVFILDRQLRHFFTTEKATRLLKGFQIHELKEYIDPYPGYSFDQGFINIIATKG